MNRPSPYIRPILFPRTGICYLENAKCGSSSILEALADRRFEDPHAGRAESRVGILRSSNAVDARNLPRWARANLVARESNRLIVSFVRNPYTRLLSAYLDLIRDPTRFPLQRMEAFGHRTDVSFAEFVELVVSQPTGRMNFHWRPQADLLDPRNVEFDFIGRVERFDEDIGLVARSRHGNSTARGREHRTDAAALVAEYYTDTIRRRVRERYEADFELFGYHEDIAAASRFDDSVLPRTPVGRGDVSRRGAGWRAAMAAARILNAVQRTRFWNLAWRGRRMVARARARRAAHE